MEHDGTIPAEAEEQRAEQRRRNQAAIDLLNSWDAGDPEESP